MEALKALNGASRQGGTSSGPITTDPELEECIRRQLATHGAENGVREVAEKVRDTDFCYKLYIVCLLIKLLKLCANYLSGTLSIAAFPSFPLFK